MIPTRLVRSIAASLLFAVSLASAHPLEPKAVIDQPAWYFHLDFDALRDSSIGKELLNEMHTPTEESRYTVLKLILGFDPRTGLHGLTVYGATPLPEDGVAIVYGDIDSTRLMALAAMAENYKSIGYRQHQVGSWIDANRRQSEGGQPRTYAAIHQNRAVLFAQRESRLLEALDVLDADRVSSLAVANPVEGSTSTNLVLQAMARQLDLPSNNPASTLFKQTKRMALEVLEPDKNLEATLTLESKAEKTAPQVASIAQGIIALISLQTDNPDAIKLAKSLSVSQSGIQTILRMKISSEDVIASMKIHAAEMSTKPSSGK